MQTISVLSKSAFSAATAKRGESEWRWMVFAWLFIAVVGIGLVMSAVESCALGDNEDGSTVPECYALVAFILGAIMSRARQPKRCQRPQRPAAEPLLYGSVGGIDDTVTGPAGAQTGPLPAPPQGEASPCSSAPSPYCVNLRDDTTSDSHGGYTARIAAAVRVGDPAGAELWLTRMHKEGVCPDIANYNSVISAWAKRGGVQRAVQLVDAMCKHDLKPDVITLGSVVHACAKAGDAQAAEAAFARITSLGSVRPDTISYNALIDAFVKAGDTQQAEHWFSKMLEQGVTPSVVSHTTLLHAHARAGDVASTERGLDRMREEGIEANVVTYSALMQACVKAGDFQRAERWFERMRQDGIKANVVTYSMLLNICAKVGDMQRAEHWIQTMFAEGVEPNVVCYNTMIDVCAKAGRGERAEAWLRQLCDEAPRRVPPFGQGAAPFAARFEEPLAPTKQSFTSAAQAHAAQGRWADVERLFSDMEGYGLLMDEFSLTVLLSSYARARPRQRERAEVAFRRHVERGLPVTRPPLRVLRGVLGVRRCDQLAIELGNQLRLDARDHDGAVELPSNRRRPFASAAPQ